MAGGGDGGLFSLRTHLFEMVETRRFLDLARPGISYCPCVMAGGGAAEIEPSGWLLAHSPFTSLASTKRIAEFVESAVRVARDRPAQRPVGRSSSRHGLGCGHGVWRCVSAHGLRW